MGDSKHSEEASSKKDTDASEAKDKQRQKQAKVIAEIWKILKTTP